MIKLLREKAHVVGWAIVITFGATMFAGTLLGSFGGEQKNHQAQHQRVKSIAYLGDTPVDTVLYRNAFSGLMQQLMSSSSRPYLTPELMELVQYNALMQVIQQQVLLQGADALKIKPNKTEINTALELVYRTYDLKDKKALKERLSSLGMSYDAYLDGVKNDIKIQKFVEHLKSEVDVSKEAIDSLYKEVNVSHILIKVSPEDSLDLKQEEVASVYAALKNGGDFAQIAKESSQDEATAKNGGNLGWITLGMTVRAFEKAAFQLQEGEISEPIRTQYGYHILKANQVKMNARPEEATAEADVERYKQLRDARVVQEYVDAYLTEHVLELSDPSLKAYRSKMEGDISGAVDAYHMQISEVPYTPIPHYMIAKVYLSAQKIALAKDELSKAFVKIELSPDSDFPDIHVLMGDILKKDKKTTEALAEYTKAFELGKNNPGFLKQLKPKLAGVSTSLQKSIDVELARIDDEIKSEQAKKEAEEAALDLESLEETP